MSAVVGPRIIRAADEEEDWEKRLLGESEVEDVEEEEDSSSRCCCCNDCNSD